MAKKLKYKIGVIDAETDPFKHGRIPEPFAWEFYSDEKTVVFWSSGSHDKDADKCDCVTCQLIEFLENETVEYMLFAHNGGKFDFHFMHQHIENPIKIINSRIVSSKLGKHVLRDSLAIIPVPLARFFKGSKGDIDYRKMEREHREKYKQEILDYLHQDCLSLFKVVSAFVERFGPKLTVGSTAMGELVKRHNFEKMKPAEDAALRPFYYGGRVECFQHGIIEGREGEPLQMLDVNSEYPKAMKSFNHPLCANFHQMEEIPDDPDQPYFIEFTGYNTGALPSYAENGSLSFNKEYGTFQACSHEINVALKYGLIKIEKIHQVYAATSWGNFAQFVDDFYGEKVSAKINKDEVTEMFSKFMLNSAYGKFGSNPENFEDWYINRDFGNDATLIANGYTLKVEYEEFELWARPASNADNSYFNVATAASITSAARSILLEGLQHAVDPMYCDTDSILCRRFNGIVSETELGAFKLEKSAMRAAIGGKKLYVLYDPETLKKPRRVWNSEFKEWDDNPERKPLKISSKGGSLTMDEIIKIAKGGRVYFENDAPTFSLHRETRFIHRNFQSTVDQMELEE